VKWLKRIAIAVVAIVAILIFGVIPYLLGGFATFNKYRYPDKENANLTPASFQLPFEDVSFHAKDGIGLKGWWVPATDAKGTVVLVHGLNRSRIEMVKKVPFLHGQGWNALLFDLRHHGDSEGALSSFGYFEREDVKAAVAFARERASGPIVLWGVSLGAVSVTLAAAEDPQVAGVVVDSAYRSMRDTVHHHLGLFRHFVWWLRIVPTWPVADEVVFWIGRRGGYDPDKVDVQAAATHLAGRPALFVCNSEDPRIPPDNAYDLKAAAGEQARVLVVPGKTHGGAYRNGTAAYETAVAQVLEAAAGGPGRQAAQASFSRSRP
jgi:pimeloyl-ACP methyl ester carboxylesterase